MRRGLCFGVFIIFLVCSTQLVLAQHQLSNDSVNLKGEDFDVTVYDPDKNLPFVDLQCEPQKESGRILVTLIFKNAGAKTLSDPEYTWDGKVSTGNPNLIPGGSQKLNVSVSYSGESVITKKARVAGYFGSNSYYTAEYTVKFYVTDDDVNARVNQGTEVDTGEYTPREEVQDIKRVLPYIYEVMDTINGIKDTILSFTPDQSSSSSSPTPHPSSPSSSPKRIIVVEEISKEKGEKRVIKEGEYAEIEYQTNVQKVIVEFDNGKKPGYRVTHKVNILESNATGSMLWMILSVSKDIAATTDSMILSEEVTVLQEDPIVGLEIPSEEESEGELDTTTLTSKNEKEFLAGIELTHSISPEEGTEVNLLGQNFPVTNYILVVTALLTTTLVFLSIRRRTSR
ncbi:MAG: hypothetical protein R6U44_06005 [Archaeoglobaceae archaeon]